jgi:hypothetical protein
MSTPNSVTNSNSNKIFGIMGKAYIRAVSVGTAANGFRKRVFFQEEEDM